MDLQAFSQKCEEVSESLDQNRKESRSTRAQKLLEVQERLRILRGVCSSAEHDEVLRKVEKQLAKDVEDLGAKLKPPKDQFPVGFRDFDYFHTVRDWVPLKKTEEGEGAGLERNLLMVLHGFGGRKEPFATLPQKFSLSTTAFLIFNAPEVLPEELLDDPPGYSWFEMIDHETGDFIPAGREERRRVNSLNRSVASLWQCVDILTTSCGWQHHEIFLFGYGQGGTVALDMVRSGSRPLGAVVAVAAEVLPEAMESSAKGLQIPVLLINGARDQCVSPKSAKASAEFLQAIGSYVEFQLFEDRAGEMLRGHHEQESRCFMTFLSDHLNGMGRKGSAEATAEAMRKIGAEPVGEAPCSHGLAEVSGHSLNEMD